MATHTVTTTPKQNRGLQYLLAEHNAALATQNPPPTPWTADQLFQELSKPLLDSLQAQGVAVGGKAIRTALDAALESGDAAKIAAVKTALGI